MGVRFQIDQRVYILPIRFWETRELDTGTVLEVGKDNFLYVFHSGYGHNVYVTKDKCFDTPEEAQTRIDELIKERDEKAQDDLDRIMERIFERKRHEETTKVG